MSKIIKRDVEKDWEFWKEIVTNPDGSINVEQVKKELSDLSILIEHTTCIYEHVTNGLISNPMTLWQAVARVSDDINIKFVEEETTALDERILELEEMIEKKNRWITLLENRIIELDERIREEEE